ncbi:MAG: hypothetical protein B7Z37_28940 [Verrucomicrobia bacterium 12-59-8]|nr:MAG: hypothetical protein B7Z37_28940 [Verrucomicrobia bacterium 12-59-8]
MMFWFKSATGRELVVPESHLLLITIGVADPKFAASPLEFVERQIQLMYLRGRSNPIQLAENRGALGFKLETPLFYGFNSAAQSMYVNLGRMSLSHQEQHGDAELLDLLLYDDITLRLIGEFDLELLRNATTLEPLGSAKLIFKSIQSLQLLRS